MTFSYGNSSIETSQQRQPLFLEVFQLTAYAPNALFMRKPLNICVSSVIILSMFGENRDWALISHQVFQALSLIGSFNGPLLPLMISFTGFWCLGRFGSTVTKRNLIVFRADHLKDLLQSCSVQSFCYIAKRIVILWYRKITRSSLVALFFPFLTFYNTLTDGIK